MITISINDLIGQIETINVKHVYINDFEIVEDILTELWVQDGLTKSK